MAKGKVACMIGSGLVLALIVIGITLIAMSFKTLGSSDVAIRYDTFYKEVLKEPFYEGMHHGPIGFQFIKFPGVFETLRYGGIKCLNEDGVSVTISVSFQYRVRSAELLTIVQQFQDFDRYGDILKYTGSSAVHDSCSLFNTTQFQSERGRFQEDLTSRLVTKFDKLGCDVTDLQVNNIARPFYYETAIKDKESAREDIEVAINERPRLETQANTTKREAITEAEIILNEAKTDAKISITKAQADAEGILNDYHKEAESYKTLKEANGLTNEGFLAYMGIRAIANAKNPVYVGMKSPAQTQFT